MIPPKTDPRWRSFVTGATPVNLTMLAARILHNRVKTMCAKGDLAAVKEAIDIAHEFFVKNEKLAAADLKALFG